MKPVSRRLSLVRHAKSSWKHADLHDFERPLNERGKRDAARMGKRLAEAGWRPDLLVSSPAKRARATARRLAEGIDYPKREIVFDGDLYEAAPDEILVVIRGLADELGHVALVGHNPGLTDLHNRLADVRIDNIPTGGVVDLELSVDRWARVEAGCARLLDFRHPKQERRSPERTSRSGAA